MAMSWSCFVVAICIRFSIRALSRAAQPGSRPGAAPPFALRGERVEHLRLGCGDRRDRPDDAPRDLVRVAHRVRTTVLEVAPVAVLDEAVRDADRRAAVRDAVGELVDRRRLVQPGQAHVVVGPVDGDVLLARIALVEKFVCMPDPFQSCSTPSGFGCQLTSTRYCSQRRSSRYRAIQTSSAARFDPLPKIWNSHCPFATSALTPSRLMPASRQRSMCASTISRATSPAFL